MARRERPIPERYERETLTTRTQKALWVALTERGLTHEQLGERLDMSGAAVSAALRRSSVQTATLERIAIAAGVDLQIQARLKAN